MAPSNRLASLWRNLDYLLLWGGQTVSNVGTAVSTIAFPLLVLMATRNILAQLLDSDMMSYFRMLIGDKKMKERN